MTDDVKRTKKGQFAPGVSGNKKGRPKKKPIPELDNSQFKDDPKAALLYLLNNATSEADVFKYSKELMPYTVPKLSSVQSEVKQEKSVTIKIEGFHNTLEVENGSNAKIVEGEVVEELTEDGLNDIKDKKLKELKDKK